jgi:hypothetical protein
MVPDTPGGLWKVSFHPGADVTAREVRITPGQDYRRGDVVWVAVEDAWIRSTVLESGAGHRLHVIAFPPINRSPRCVCDSNGMVCEFHPNRHPDHEGCQGAAIACEREDCPRWEELPGGGRRQLA